ncbi:MAG: DnaD and phage-associated domain [Erysipelotrichaceae bacterium]|nr:MAG: DnaD and phage-associated [Erysipelotrichaceae bacterium]TXT18274.1 MAG: DnaD and phage-associated domain [Erysipelotrichaceae bacterium]
MERNKNAIIHIESFSNPLDTTSLFMVYQKLCSSSAIALYGVMVHLSVPEHFTHAQLTELLGTTHEKLLSDFEALEQVSLLESYHHPVDDSYLYVMKMPLKITEALNHPVLGRAYLKSVGEVHYDTIKQRYASHKVVKSGYESISKPFEAHRLKDFDPQSETHFIPENSELSGLRFNILELKQRCSDLVFPPQLRTAENLKSIEELGSVYGVTVAKMIQCLGDCINIHTLTFDTDKLEGLIRKVKDPIPLPDDPYMSEPVVFLRWLQEGKEPTDTEKRLLSSLVIEQRLNPEVVNVLVKHALDSSNQSLKKAYVETIAASWSRLKITTKAQALAHIQGISKKPEKGRKEAIPDYKAESEPMSNNELDDLKARLKKLGEKHGKD